MAQNMVLSSKPLVATPVRGSAFAGRSLSKAVVRPAQICKAADRTWFPGNARPAHLDGSQPGDYGFDPLGLSSDADWARWMQQAELIHCRTSMMGVAGILLPGLATHYGIGDTPQWYEAGKVWIDNHPAFPFPSLLFVQLILCHWVETKRWADFQNPGSQGDGSFFGITDGLKGQSNGYPGGIFDPLGFSKGSKEEQDKYKWNELTNGRLAMVSFAGYAFQYAATGKGPVENLFDHVADPFHVTFATNGVSLPFVSP